MDEQKTRREFIRWCLLRALDNARTHGAVEETLLAIIQAMYADATRNEARRELEYLAGRDLIDLMKRPNGHWEAKISRFGTDIVEYTVDCDPGIGRPPKLD